MKRKLILTLALLCLAAFILTLAAAFLIGRKVGQPLVNLAEQASKIADKPSDLLLSEDKIQYAEFRKLTRSFNQVLKSLSAVQEKLNQRSRQALRESEEKFSKLFQANPIYTSISSLEEGRFIEVNDAFTRMTGYTREEVIGKSSIEVGLWADPEQRHLLGKVAKEQGGFQSQEIDFIHKNGGPMVFLWSAEKIQLEGEVCLVTGCVDITERKRLEANLRHRQKTEAIGTLAGGIAHDFNNILSPIIGYSELACMGLQEGSETLKNIREVLNAGHRAKDLVKQILTFSRQKEEKRSPLELAPIIKEVLKLLRASIPATVEIRSAIQDCGMVKADPTQIHQVVMNLCTNAAQAMEDSGGILEVTLGMIEIRENSPAQKLNLVPGHYALLTTKDTGPGIAQEIRDKIFDPYFTTKQQDRGTGLGLAVVQGIVKSHNGIITIKTEIGNGTAFKVWLPIIESQSKPHKAESPEIPTGNQRILFVDDMPPLVELGRQLLEKLGYRVTTETDSEKALWLFKQAPNDFDLVITDMTMPRMTGDQLAKGLMDIRPDIPVILCSGYSNSISDETASKIGIRAFIPKPLGIQNLGTVIRKVLDNKPHGIFDS